VADDALDEAARVLAGCRQAVALTGAGISVESGIPDFRSAGGLWERFDPMVYATIETFRQTPERSWELFVEVDEVLRSAEPNAGHRALAELERLGVLGSVITQNIDGLHQAAGSRTVREFHGSHAQLHCVWCHARYPQERARSGGLPRCDCGRPLKPAVVLFGEAIPDAPMRDSAHDADRADAILVVGTSAEVYPAAAIPHRVAERGGPVIVVDLEPTSLTRQVPCTFLEGAAGTVLPQLVDRIRQVMEKSGEAVVRRGGPGEEVLG